MRKILAVLMLVCALGLFAQIPAGTKSVAVLTGEIGDLMADDFNYGVNVMAGYFIMDGLEIDAILGLWGTTVEDVDMIFDLGLEALYHYPLSPMLGLYVGAGFIFSTESFGEEDNTMSIPIDAGLEIFLTPNNAVRLGNRFSVNLTEGMDNTDHIVIGTVHYF
jgi:hypothetical protein